MDKKDEAPEVKLPKLTPAEHKVYNRLADGMNYYHDHFKSTWTLLHKACTNNSRPSGMSIRQFLTTALEFAHHLTMHHTIEERHIFPVLARKMPKFRKELELLTQHKQIHEGLEKFEVYLGECRTGERELRLGELKVLMDGFGGVLWEHLDEEVEELGAENMRRYWSLEEMRGMPM
ncbi:hypothetical protein EJ08DRAFT_701058 [Tothia fuscella]|uniref:Hemerythrin-like domain-containing protein n=1 Tax=Tothia fuscella TaxID=1048955 RepID=A0A9P4TUV5_9PEZI|nr:hypothetical protein EJ08DRAFT_701058 [Tothia fuscella]